MGVNMGCTLWCKHVFKHGSLNVLVHKGSSKVINMGLNKGVNIGVTIGAHMGVNIDVNMIIDLNDGRPQRFKLNLTLF